MNKFFLGFFIFPLIINGFQHNNALPYYRLKNDLYDGYDQYIRPVKNPKTITNVTIGFTLSQVLSFVS